MEAFKITYLEKLHMGKDKIFILSVGLFCLEMVSNSQRSGTDPMLHRGVDTYCYSPAVVAEFVSGSEAGGLESNLYLLLYEHRNRVFGEVLVEYASPRFCCSPHINMDLPPSTQDVEFESADHADPIVALGESITGLLETAESVFASEPILLSLTVHDSSFVEVGVTLFHEFGTPLSSMQGVISSADVIPPIESNGLAKDQIAGVPWVD